MFYNSEKLGNILRTARIRKNLSPYFLRTRKLIDQVMLKRIETGEARISLNTFLRLCNYYGLDPYEVLKEVIN